MLKEFTAIQTSRYILLSIEFTENWKASWEELQAIKNKYFNELRFIEIYPLQSEVVNRANVRHLYHVKHFPLPDLNKLEEEKQWALLHSEKV